MSVAGHHLPIWFDEATGPDDGDVSVWNSATGRFESAPVVGGAIPPGTYVEDGSALFVARGSVPDWNGTTGTVNTSALQDAIDEAAESVPDVSPLNEAQPIATLKIPPGRYLTGPLTLPGRVHLDFNGATLVPSTSGALITITNFHNRLSNLHIEGRGSAQGASGVVFASGARWNVIDVARFGNLAGRALHFAPGSISNQVRSLFAVDCLLDTAAVLAYTGAVEVNGTDNLLQDSEIAYAGGRGSPLVSVDQHFVALVIKGAEHWIRDTMASLSDAGVYLLATGVHLSHVRADLNRGHGWILDGPGNGVLTSCRSRENSQASFTTHDGFHTVDAASAMNYRLVNPVAHAIPSHHGRGFYDSQSSETAKNTYIGPWSIGHSVKAFEAAASAGARVHFDPQPMYNSGPINATTVAVDQLSDYKFHNTVPTSVTDLTNGVNGQVVRLYGDGQTTLVHDLAKIVMHGGEDLFLVAARPYQFQLQNGIWYQLGSSLEALASTATTRLGYQALKVNTGAFNTAVGVNALLANSTGTDNTAFGYHALQAAVTAQYNTAVGMNALAANTGNQNTAVGRGALQANTSGLGSTAVGYGALILSTGGSNTAIGADALGTNNTGATNTAIGRRTLTGNTTGSDNTAVGYQALNLPANVGGNATTTGLRQTAIGVQTGQNSATQRNDVVCVGYNALVDGNNAIAIGSGVLAGAAGAVAIGKDSANTSASTTTADEIKLGTALHTLTVIGNAKVGGAAKTLGFYGAAGVAKQTGVTVDAAGIHAALVALNLIAA